MYILLVMSHDICNIYEWFCMHTLVVQIIGNQCNGYMPGSFKYAESLHVKMYILALYWALGVFVILAFSPMNSMPLLPPSYIERVSRALSPRRKQNVANTKSLPPAKIHIIPFHFAIVKSKLSFCMKNENCKGNGFNQQRYKFYQSKTVSPLCVCVY